MRFKENRFFITTYWPLSSKIQNNSRDTIGRHIALASTSQAIINTVVAFLPGWEVKFVLPFQSRIASSLAKMGSCPNSDFMVCDGRVMHTCILQMWEVSSAAILYFSWKGCPCFVSFVEWYAGRRTVLVGGSASPIQCDCVHVYSLMFPIPLNPDIVVWIFVASSCQGTDSVI